MTGHGVTSGHVHASSPRHRLFIPIFVHSKKTCGSKSGSEGLAHLGEEPTRALRVLNRRFGADHDGAEVEAEVNEP